MRFLLERLNEPRRFIQVLAGPRQVGKTTSILQVLDDLQVPFHYASAGPPALHGTTWIEQQYEQENISLDILREIRKEIER